MRPWRGRADERGVTDVIGSVLLVGITIAAFTGLAIVVAQLDAPEDPTRATLALDVASGPGGWGTGDESLVVTHQGGEAVSRDDIRILAQVAQSTIVLQGSDLTGPFSDGRLTVGEVWSYGLTVAEDDRVAMDIVDVAGNRLVASLSYEKAGLAGLSGAFGPIVSLTYADSASAIIGSVSSFSAAQSDSDSDAAAVFQEGTSGPGGLSLTQSANAVISAGSFDDTTPAGKGFASDDVRTVTPATNIPIGIKYSLSDPPLSLGTITAVTLKAEIQSSRSTGDWQMQGCILALCTPASAILDTTVDSDATIQYDITGLKPGGGAWTWADVVALDQVITPVKNGGGGPPVWRIDHAYVQVDYQGTLYEMDITSTFIGVAAGSTYDLQMRYKTSGDTFGVEVWDGASWTPRGVALDSASFVTWTYTLAASEYQGGAPQLRFTDQTPTGTTQGTLELDYIRVRTVA